MSRYINEIQTAMSEVNTINTLSSMLQMEGFSYVNFRGEMLWKKGNGIIAAPQFIKFTYLNNIVRVEAWIKMAWLSGVYSGEMNLDGFFGFAIKDMLKTRVKRLEYVLACATPEIQSQTAQV